MNLLLQPQLSVLPVSLSNQVLAVMAMLNFQKFSGLLLLNLAMPLKITAAPFGPRAMVSSLEVFCCVKIASILAIRWLLLLGPQLPLVLERPSPVLET